MSKRAINLLRAQALGMNAKIKTLEVASTTTLSGNVTLTAQGMPVVALSDVTSLIGGAGNYDVTITQPANTTILEFGIIATQSSDDSGNYDLILGTSTGNDELIATTRVVSSNTWDANEGISTAGLLSESDVVMNFDGDDPEYHTTSERTLTCRIATPGTNTTGYVRAWAKFIYM